MARQLRGVLVAAAALATSCGSGEGCRGGHQADVPPVGELCRLAYRGFDDWPPGRQEVCREGEQQLRARDETAWRSLVACAGPSEPSPRQRKAEQRCIADAVGELFGAHRLDVARTGIAQCDHAVRLHDACYALLYPAGDAQGRDEVEALVQRYRGDPDRAKVDDECVSQLAAGARLMLRGCTP